MQVILALRHLTLAGWGSAVVQVEELGLARRFLLRLLVDEASAIRVVVWWGVGAVVSDGEEGGCLDWV